MLWALRRRDLQHTQPLTADPFLATRLVGGSLSSGRGARESWCWRIRARDRPRFENPGDAEATQRSLAPLMELAISSRVPTTFGMRPTLIPQQLAMFDQVAADGGRMFGMTRSEAFGMILSFKSRLPFDGLVEWREFRSRPLAEQKSLLADRAVRDRLVEATDVAYREAGSGTHALPRYEDILVMLHAGERNPTVAEMAQASGKGPAELMIDLSLESDFERVFMKITGWKDDELLTAMRHPRTVMTFSDQGAHVGQSPGAANSDQTIGTLGSGSSAFYLGGRGPNADPCSGFGLGYS